MRPIDADALHDMLQYLEDRTTKKAYEKIDFQAAYTAGVVDGIKQKVANFPTLDYAPVRHGEWMPIEEPQWNCFGLVTIGYRCSECGREEPYNHDPYCHCGAKMDGGKKDG